MFSNPVNINDLSLIDSHKNHLFEVAHNASGILNDSANTSFDTSLLTRLKDCSFSQVREETPFGPANAKSGLIDIHALLDQLRKYQYRDVIHRAEVSKLRQLAQGYKAQVDDLTEEVKKLRNSREQEAKYVKRLEDEVNNLRYEKYLSDIVDNTHMQSGVLTLNSLKHDDLYSEPLETMVSLPSRQKAEAQQKNGGKINSLFRELDPLAGGKTATSTRIDQEQDCNTMNSSLADFYMAEEKLQNFKITYPTSTSRLVTFEDSNKENYNHGNYHQPQQQQASYCDFQYHRSPTDSRGPVEIEQAFFQNGNKGQGGADIRQPPRNKPPVISKDMLKIDLTKIALLN